MESALHEIAPAGLKVIETFRCDPSDGFVRLAAHLDRAEATCARLRFAFDRGRVLNALSVVEAGKALRVRLTIDADGRAEVSYAPLVANPDVWRVMVSDVILDADDPWLAVKTTERSIYDSARAGLPDGVDEVVFCNLAGGLCEGSITNIFVQDGDRYLTPPLTNGVLPGVLRGEMLGDGTAVEAELTLDDLKTAEAWYLGNSLRGLIKGQLI